MARVVIVPGHVDSDEIRMGCERFVVMQDEAPLLKIDCYLDYCSAYWSHRLNAKQLTTEIRALYEKIDSSHPGTLSHEGYCTIASEATVDFGPAPVRDLLEHHLRPPYPEGVRLYTPSINVWGTAYRPGAKSTEVGIICKYCVPEVITSFFSATSGVSTKETYSQITREIRNTIAHFPRL
jgi:hypothetical protein